MKPYEKSINMSNALNKIKIRNHFIPDIEWTDIPKFSVITGVNGSGKTQLLNAINSAALKNACFFDCESDLEVEKAEFGFVPWNQGQSRLGGSHYAQFEKELLAFSKECITGRISNRNAANWQIYLYIKKKSGVELKGQPENFFEKTEFRDNFKEAWTYTVETTLNQHISRLFVQYKMNYEEKIQQTYDPETGSSLTKKQIEKDLGEPPWETINNLFSQYGFKYRINSPERAISHYTVIFHDKNNEDIHIPPNQLSSGEQMIVTLILWSFNEKVGELKKLLILDEPDAHLHPQMAKMFKEILSDILVKKFGIQIIMTTHSPTTLCWIDEENIFLMKPDVGLEKASKKEALSKLTSGLLYVHQAFKIVLVEDEDDKKFHQRIYDELAYSDIILKDPNLVFKSVVTPGVNGGGKSVVMNACKQWSEFSSQTDLDDVLFGLVDKDNDDNSNLPTNTYPLSRYCHENYLADPLLIFVLMIEEQVDDERIKTIAEKHEYRKGETLKFKNNDVLSVQEIADEIIKILVASTDCALSNKQIADKETIQYVNGMEIHIPKHFLSESGKDVVLDYYKKVFIKGAGRMNVDRLTNIATITHLIPSDLVDIYKKYL